MRVTWSPTTLREIKRAFDHLTELNPRAASELVADLLKAGDGLVNFPFRGRPVEGTRMRELVTRHPYVIRYRIVGDEARILRMRHTARRPTNP